MKIAVLTCGMLPVPAVQGGVSAVTFTIVAPYARLPAETAPHRKSLLDVSMLSLSNGIAADQKPAFGADD